MISKVAGLAAVTHIVFFPLLEANWQRRMHTDIEFMVRAYDMGYYSAVMCSPGSGQENRPHSPYHQGSVACHAYTVGSGNGKRRSDTGCCDVTGSDLGMNGIPQADSVLAKRKGIFWDYIIAQAQRANPNRFVPGQRRLRLGA